MTALTPRQRAIYEWVAAFMGSRGYAPTLREIGAAFGIRSTNGVADALRALERKGFIRRGDPSARRVACRTIICLQPADGNLSAALPPTPPVVEPAELTVEISRLFTDREAALEHLKAIDDTIRSLVRYGRLRKSAPAASTNGGAS